ncbi:MAG: hypothetical protein PUA85_01945 [Oscillospiraceae bacterium]|nr:hypothetical protein [Oscillospiraceae bacterium]
MSQSTRKIVVDTYGADLGEEIIVRGVLTALEEYPRLGAVIVGSREVFNKAIGESNIEKDRIEFIEAEDFILSTDAPTCVFGGRDKSSMVLALNTLKQREDCFAALSPGNTGALFVGSMCRLGLRKGVKAPVLSAAIPTPHDKWVCLLDCGASLSCTPADLEKFAFLGAEFAELAFGIPNPRVGLLSNGREENKGSELTKAAYTLLKKADINFIGNIESYDLLSEEVEVVVADGFTGNIMLKSVEAVGSAAIKVVERVGRELGIENSPEIEKIIDAMSHKFDLNIYGGATFLGTVKPLVKMHGCSTEATVKSCIEQLIRVENAVNQNSQQ